MSDILCPYCNEEIEINHDDGYGYEEDKTYEQECYNCEKTFVYWTTISFDYGARQAPCRNGGEHDLRDIHGVPKEYYVGKKRCKVCSHEIMVDKEANVKALKSYFESMKQQKASGHE